MKEPSLHNTSPHLQVYHPWWLTLGRWTDAILNRLPSQGAKFTSFEETPNKILVIQSHLIGDLIMASPLLSGLKTLFPSARIDLLANPVAQDLYKHNPAIDVLHTTPFPYGILDFSLSARWTLLQKTNTLKKEQYDLVIDAQMDLRNIFLMKHMAIPRRVGLPYAGGEALLTDCVHADTSVANLQDFRNQLLKYLNPNIDPTHLKPHIYLGSKDHESVTHFIQQHALTSFIVIHPGASLAIKRWAPEKFATVINNLPAHHQVLVIQAPKEEKTVQSILDQAPKSIRFKGSLREVYALLEKATFCLCLDSACSHLAAAAGTKTLVLANKHYSYEHIKPPAPTVHGLTPTAPHTRLNQLHPDQVIKAIHKQLPISQGSPTTDATKR